MFWNLLNLVARTLDHLRTFLACAALAVLSNAANAQLVVTPQANVQALAAAISGPGVTISNPTINCHAEGFGEFAYSGSQLGLDEGVILTSGRRDNAVGPNNSGSTAFNAARQGSPILNIVTGRTTFDQCKLEFDIIPAGDSLKFNFAFGSEEYNEWVGTQFNDVFGFFISGPGITGDPGIGSDHNIALIPGGTQPVTINNVNNGSNSLYYHDNTGGSEIQYDGFTQNLSAVSLVQPCQTYHLKLIVADATDNDYDSGVLIEKVQSNPVTMQAFTQNGGADLIEGCNNGYVRFTRSTALPQPLSLTYFLQGTATNGVDYQAINPTNPNSPKTIVIPANQLFVDRPITTLINTAAEPDESLIFILGNPNCPAMALDTLTMNLVDTIASSVTPLTAGICLGDSVQFQVTGGSQWTWTPATGLSAANIANPWARPTSSTNYQVVISDGLGCSKTIRPRIRVSDMSLSATTTAVLCNGGTNGAINLTVTGGIAPFTYSWTGPGGFTANTQDITLRPAGIYTVTVTDAACTKTQSYTISQPNALSVTLAPTVLAFGQNITCFGSNTGAIDATISGGTAPYTVAWTGPSGYTSSNVDINSLSAGAYTISITDFNGCARTASVTLLQAPALSASISASANVTCKSLNNGTATVTVSGGVPPYSYAWNTTPVKTTASVTGLRPGNRIVTVTDAYGCTTTASVVITEPAQDLASNLVSQTNVLCRGASTGSATVSANGGTAPYTFSWNTTPVQNTAAASNLPAGTWTCTITDARGCTTTRAVTITQPAAGITTALTTSSNVSCFGGSNGSATISAAGGNPPYSFSWNTTPVQTGASATNLPVGTWTCTVTDASGCTATRPVPITQPTSLPSGSVNSLNHNQCFGQSNGSATVSGSGGTAPYTYSWNTTPVQTGSTVTNQLAGTYICTITDARGCTAAVSAVINSPAQLVGTITSDIDVACFGQSTGSATVGASGGTGAYTFTWNTSPPQSTSSATNIPFGAYTATVTDQNGCSTTANVVISQPASPLSTTAVVSPAACGGPNTGAVDATVSGGTSPYSYSWSGPSGFTATTQDISSLAAGVYTLLVTDANSCTRSTVWNVNQPGLFTITAVLSDYNGFNVGCRNGSNGSIDVTVTGATAPYTYSWTGPSGFTATTEDISGRPAGNYTFTVTDALGCSNAQAFTLTQPTAIYNTLTPAIGGNGYNVTCFGGSNGSITSAPGGGVGTFSYAWSGPGAFTASTQNISGRIAGTYNLIVTDQNGCTLASSVTLTQPVQLTASIAVNNHVSCRSGTNGSATATPLGGVAPYSYSWNTVPVKTTALATNLAAGNYICTVTDANGCATTANVTITQPAAALSTALVSQTNLLCRGVFTGSATVNASGGTAPYTYSWNTIPVQTGTTAINMPAGTFNCTAMDALGCTSVRPVTITQPATAPDCSFIDNVVHVTCFGLNNGSARANGCGGTPGYTYSWDSSPIQTTATATGLPPGFYTCTITDANGCVRLRTVTINGPSAALSASISAQSNELCGGVGPGTGSATVSVSGGTAPFTYSWNTTPVQTGATATALQNGSYTCTVTDARGCGATTTATITEPIAIGNTLVSISQVTCTGANNGTATVAGTGGTPPYAFLWSTGAATASISGLAPGNYSCTVRDANNCSSVRNITITQPPALFVTAAIQTASCQGANSGGVNLTVAGGVAPYSYAWTGDNGFTANTQDISLLPAGVFDVVVTDANGCTNSSSWTVTDPGSFTINSVQGVMANGLNLLCNGGNNAWITNEVRGGQAPYSYSWTGPSGYTATTDDVSGLSGGNYVFTVSDANGCSTSVSFTVTQPVAFSSSIIGANSGGGFNISCAGGSNGATSGSITGGNAPLSYAWSGPGAFTANTANISGRPAGVYNLVVTDAFGCSFNTSVTLTQPPALSASTTVVANVLCNGASTGSATASANGGVAPYSYGWNTVPAQSGPLANNLAAGTWVCTVTDANGCTTNANVIISQPATSLSANVGGTTPVSCFGGNNGTATVSASGGTPNYSYSWNTAPAQSTATATGLAAGNYTCTVTDANGCSAVVNASVTEPSAALSASIPTQTNVLCFGNATGSANVIAAGGTSPYLYSWNTTPVQNTATANSLAAGNWTCTITDSRGCTVSVNATITQPVAPLAAGIPSQTNVLCFGNSTGNATVSVNGGTSAYTFNWNTTPAQTNATAIGLAAGNYTCTVTDANGCTTAANAAISQPAALLNATISAQTDVLCFGNSTGTAAVSVSGGTAAYGYSWNTAPVQTTSMATGLAAGSYTCTVTDANGCTSSVNTTITQPAAALSASISTQTNVLCFGNSTGSATVSAAGGAPSYSFNWNTAPVQTTATASNLSAGNYTCTITDANGCTTTRNVTITQPAAALSASISAQTNVLCFGNSTGSATASAVGGTAPFAFSWNTFPVQTSASVAGLAAGSHTCTITDANGCSTTVIATITQPAASIDVTASVTPAACQGANNGAVNATVTGGTGPYSYSWSGPNGFTASTQDIAGIEAGVYILITTDANGCTHTSNWNVNQPGLFTLSGITSNYIGGVQVSCIGATDGSIDITVSGATPPYTYSWTGPSGYMNSVQDISGLAAGTYTFVVTDANGCSTSQTFTLNAPTPFNITLSGADQGGGFNISCNGGNNGSIDATATGGSAPLAFAWSGPNAFSANTSDISGLVAGTYTLIVTDVNGCTANASITLTEPNALSATASTTAQVDCFGGMNGSATSSGSAGVAPYIYQWNTVPAQNTQNANGLSAGTWTVTITDANGCTSNASAVITEPAGTLSASIIAQTNVLCFGNSTGSATASASAGTAPYSYSWNTVPVQTNATASGLAAGTYTCTITDQNGCSTTANATITEPSASLDVVISGQSPVRCFGGADGSAIANATGGTGPYTYGWNTAPTQNGTNLTNVSAGTYTVSVTDANGCAANTQVTIAEPNAPLNVGTASIIHQDCFGSTNGQATVNATGGTGPYTYSWNTNPAQTAATAIGLGAGTYNVIATDARNCTASLDVTINGPSAALSLAITSTTDVLCFGSNTGAATSDAAGGTAPYTYEWSTTPQTFAASIVGQSAGTYAVIVTDANGCLASSNTTINQPLTEITPFLESISMVNCFGGSDAFATIDISGGSGNYSVVWNTFPVQTGNTVTGLAAGTYLAEITDNNGCSISKYFPLTVTEPSAALTATSTAHLFGGGYNTSCSYANDGSINATISGGTLPYTYSWADPFGGTLTTEDITGLAPGNYDLLVTDDNGCTAATNATINAPAPIDITSTIVPAACQGAATGSINTNPLGGVAPYTLSWTGPNGFTASTADIAGLVAGVYTLNITDANGCSGSFQLDVNQPGLFTITATLSSFIGGTNVSCATAADGSIDVTAAGGTPGYTYSWTGPNGFTANTEDISGLTAGTYDLQLNDANGCGTLVSYTLTAPATLNVSLIATLHDVDNISCNGGSDGAIDATIVGGTAPYAITWTGPNGFTANAEDIGSLTAGTYDITVTDVNGCSANSSITLTEPTILTASATPTVQANGDNITCNGSNDGSIDLGIVGGHGPYAVLWTGPNGFTSGNQDINGLAAGTYASLISDASGCTTSLSVTLTEPAPLVLASALSSYVGGQAVGCYGANDGSIELTITGGAGNLQFAWTGSNAFVSTNEDLLNLYAGTYSVVVSDQNSCATDTSFVLSQPLPIIPSAIIGHVNCFGQNTGYINLMIAGGTAPFSVSWIGPGAFSASTEDLTDLFSGVYIATITDANGCSRIQPFNVNETDAFSITAISSVYSGGYHVSCNGADDGAIDATIQGGTAPYFYQWIGPDGFTANTEDLTQLAAGTYFLIITDQNGCQGLAQQTLVEPSPVNIGLVAGLYNGGVNTTCASTPDGTIDATIAGGEQPYTIVWSGPNGFTSVIEDISGAAAGDYTMVVTDAIGCTASANITLVEPTAITSAVSAAVLNGGSSTSCNGNADGSIDLTIADGTQPYTIAWSGPNGFGSNNEDISNLSAGSYTAVVTDANGCTSTSNITLTAPSVIDIELTASQFSGGYNIPCFGSSLGTITATIAGGLPGYTYLWNSNSGFSSTDQDLTGVPAGDYTITVTDANGCTGAASITLFEPDQLDATSTLSATGNGFEVSCAGNDGAIAVNVTGGTQPVQFAWFSPNGFASQDEDITGLSAGTYELTIIDDNGCVFSDTLILTQPEQLDGTITPSGVICNGANDGSIDLEVTGGASAYTYAWTGPNGFTATTEDLSGLSGGDYNVVVSDNGNCTGTWNATIIASGAMTADVYRSDYGGISIPCFGDSTGVIEVGVLGGVDPLTIAWTGPNGFTSSAYDLSGLIAGDYQFTITDANGCSMDSTINLTQPSTALGNALTAAVFQSGTNVSCFGTSTGSIDATITGGILPYTFDWRGPDSSSFNTEDITGLAAGDYTLVVMDANSCASTATITLTQPDSTVIDATLSQFNGGLNTTCDGSSDGSISVVITGGSPEHSLTWTGPNGFSSTNDTVTSLTAGIYTLSTTDINGCSASAEVELIAPEPILPALLSDVFPSGSNISCTGLNDGSVQTSISGGTPGYTFTWTGPNGFSSQQDSISSLFAGEYCVSVMDANGCTTQQCITLVEPAQLNVTATATSADCGQNSGDVDASVTGGSAPFTYAWNTGATTEDLADVGLNTYQLVATDLNGCTDTVTVDVLGSPAITGTAVVADARCNGNPDGTIDLTMLTGTAPFQFDWTGNVSTEDLTGLPAGSFQVHVTDASGCSWSDVFTVNEPDPISVDSTILVHGNGFNISALGALDGSIAVSASGGTAPFTYLWSNGTTDTTVEGLGEGTWTVTITDANGCSRTLEFTLDAPNDIEMPTGFTPNGDGHNDLFVIHGIEAFPNNQLLVFNRWGNLVYDRINYKNDWAGENQQGEFLTNGTYFLILRLGSDATNLQGYVDLRR